MEISIYCFIGCHWPNRYELASIRIFAHTYPRGGWVALTATSHAHKELTIIIFLRFVIFYGRRSVPDRLIKHYTLVLHVRCGTYILIYVLQWADPCNSELSWKYHASVIEVIPRMSNSCPEVCGGRATWMKERWNCKKKSDETCLIRRTQSCIYKYIHDKKYTCKM